MQEKTRKLYEVTFEIAAYAWGEDERSAINEAKEALEDVYVQDFAVASEVTEKSYIDADWVDCIPYGKPPDGLKDVVVNGILEKLKQKGQ